MTRKPAPMADDVLELTRKCAEAMGLKEREDRSHGHNIMVAGAAFTGLWCPKENPAQAFELLCKFKLHISPPDEQDSRWEAYTLRDPLDPDGGVTAHALDESLNIAIMKCIVELQDGR